MGSYNNISSFQGKTPFIHETAFIDQSARVIGDVVISEGSSVWPMAVIRADSASVLIEKHTAVLDQCLIEAPEDSPVSIGEGSLVSHGVIVHGAIVGPGVLFGIGSIILDNVTIGEGSIVSAGSIVTSRTAIPPNSMVAGSPARVIRETTAKERDYIKRQVEGLYHKSRDYMKENG